MKSLEKVRNHLNRAIISGCSKEEILSISQYLDNLIVEHMKVKNKKYISKGR